MRTFFLCAILLPLCQALFAQTELPKFGNIEKEELLKKNCDYDPDAEAEVLIDYGSMQYQVSAQMVSTEMEYRVRLKILKEKGLEQANISLPYYNQTRAETITRLEAVTYNLDANGQVVVTKLDKANIFDKKIDKRWNEIVFSMPEAKVGSVIEYKFKKISRGLNVNSWYFQRQIPVRLSYYIVDLPKILKYAEKSTVYQQIDVREKEMANDLIKLYVLRDIPGLHMEPFMSSPNDYLEKLEFQLVGLDVPGQPFVPINRTWAKMGESLLEDEDFGSAIRKNLRFSPEFDARLKGIKDPAQKMIAIYDHVRQSMTWNNKHSIWALDGVKSAWEKKAGNSGEINLILINLLKDADLNVHPLMVSTRTNGRINTFYPNLNQFNTVMAYVEIGDASYVLDATDKITPAHMIPHSVLYTEGMLVVNKENVRWVMMDPAKQRYRMTVMVQGDINTEGLLKGEAKVYSFDYSRNDRMQVWKQGKEKFSEAYFTSAYPNLKIENLEVGNDKNDSLPLEQVLKFNIPLTSSGDYSYFSTNLFLGLEKNSFIADKRATDIDFGYNQSYTLVGVFNIPEGYEVEELPKNKRMILPDTTIMLTRIMQMNDRTLNIRMNLDFTRPIFYTDEYEPFHEFYKQLYATLNEQVVVRRKKAQP